MTNVELDDDGCEVPYVTQNIGLGAVQGPANDMPVALETLTVALENTLLMRCPFCGKLDINTGTNCEYNEVNKLYFAEAECGNCHASIPGKPQSDADNAVQSARDAWNHRAEFRAVIQAEAEYEKLKRVCEQYRKHSNEHFQRANQAESRLDAAQAREAVLRQALVRLRDGTPIITNSRNAQEQFSFTFAVAGTALANVAAPAGEDAREALAAKIREAYGVNREVSK